VFSVRGQVRTIWTIQGVSRLVVITAGCDFLGLCDQKSSYKHVSDFSGEAGRSPTITLPTTTRFKNMSSFYSPFQKHFKICVIFAPPYIKHALLPKCTLIWSVSEFNKKTTLFVLL
jgi:hypothetical protein